MRQKLVNAIIESLNEHYPLTIDFPDQLADELISKFQITIISESKQFKNYGRVFGDFTVIGKVEGRKGLYYKCECSCGHTRDIAYANLISGAISICKECSKKLA